MELQPRKPSAQGSGRVVHRRRLDRLDRAGAGAIGAWRVSAVHFVSWLRAPRWHCRASDRPSTSPRAKDSSSRGASPIVTVRAGDHVAHAARRVALARCQPGPLHDRTSRSPRAAPEWGDHVTGRRVPRRLGAVAPAAVGLLVGLLARRRRMRSMKNSAAAMSIDQQREAARRRGRRSRRPPCRRRRAAARRPAAATDQRARVRRPMQTRSSVGSGARWLPHAFGSWPSHAFVGSGSDAGVGGTSAARGRGFGRSLRGLAVLLVPVQREQAETEQDHRRDERDDRRHGAASRGRAR